MRHHLIVKLRIQLGSMLQKSRKARGLTQAQVARRLGLKTGQVISDLERGRAQSFPPGLLIHLAKLYGIDHEQVVNLYIESEKERLEFKLRRKIRLSALAEELKS